MVQIEKVWIIDDDPITALIAKKAVKILLPKSIVQTFRNGVPALEALQQITEIGGKLPDIIFLDIRMPYMTGFEFLEKTVLQKTPLHASKVYLYSNSITPQHIENARTFMFPITGLITKPLTLDKLEELFKKPAFVIGTPQQVP